MTTTFRKSLVCLCPLEFTDGAGSFVIDITRNTMAPKRPESKGSSSRPACLSNETFHYRAPGLQIQLQLHVRYLPLSHRHTTGSTYGVAEPASYLIWLAALWLLRIFSRKVENINLNINEHGVSYVGHGGEKSWRDWCCSLVCSVLRELHEQCVMD